MPAARASLRSASCGNGLAAALDPTSTQWGRRQTGAANRHGTPVEVLRGRRRHRVSPPGASQVAQQGFGRSPRLSGAHRRVARSRVRRARSRRRASGRVRPGHGSGHRASPAADRDRAGGGQGARYPSPGPGSGLPTLWRVLEGGASDRVGWRLRMRRAEMADVVAATFGAAVVTGLGPAVPVSLPQPPHNEDAVRCQGGRTCGVERPGQPLR